MKPRNLVILALVVAAVGAYIFFYERHQPTSDEIRERADKVFPDFDRDSVTALEVRNSHGEFSLVKSGGTWRLTSPIDFPADSSTVGSLLGSLGNLKQERKLSPTDVDPADYGLGTPALFVMAATEDGTRFALEVGDETPLGSNRAVRRHGDEHIVVCSDYFVTDLDKELDDWRSRDVIDVVADDLASLQVVSGSDRIHLVHSDDDWRLVEPIDDLADGDHVSNLISNLNALRIEEFIDAGADSAELGLDDPEFRVTLVRTEGASPSQIDFGNTRDQDGVTRIACRRDGVEYFWVNDVAAARLAKAPVLWRSPKVYTFDSWNAEGLTIAVEDTEVELTRTEGLWSSADGGELDYGAVQDRLSKLANLEAHEFDLTAPSTPELGRIELTLKPSAADDQSAPLKVSYTFFRPMEEGGDAVVMVNTRGTVMSVNAEAVQEILADPSTLIEEPAPDTADSEPTE
jgi:hypothetical protein